jgi:hypothetical protein
MPSCPWNLLVTAGGVQGMAPYPGQARFLALGFWPECFRRLDVRGGRRPFPKETRSALDIEGKHVTIQGPSPDLSPARTVAPSLVCRSPRSPPLGLSARESVPSGLRCGLTCEASRPRVTVRAPSCPGLMARRPLRPELAAPLGVAYRPSYLGALVAVLAGDCKGPLLYFRAVRHAVDPCLQIAVSSCDSGSDQRRPLSGVDPGVPLSTGANGTLRRRRPITRGLILLVKASRRRPRRCRRVCNRRVIPRRALMARRSWFI